MIKCGMRLKRAYCGHGQAETCWNDTTQENVLKELTEPAREFLLSDGFVFLCCQVGDTKVEVWKKEKREFTPEEQAQATYAIEKALYTERPSSFRRKDD